MRPLCSADLRLAVDEIVHHDDVMLLIVVRPRGNIAGRDPDRGDAGVIKLDAEEGEISIARRGRNETAEYQPGVSVEVLMDVLPLRLLSCGPGPPPFG